MVIYYDNNGGTVRTIRMVEHDVMLPTMPANMDAHELVVYYNGIGLHYASVPYEMGGGVFHYDVCVNDTGFVGLQPKEVKEE